ncbi:colorectal cancer-associated protein 2 [Camelus ferus]|uniref:Colorectal cancer-associated protein 2 n=1 Tax=Camelus ferus TaxID=419612 RepID=A0A8B8SD99_CAMFR|nr:colorectal cancer-associated protein 2 [Camelus ferus]
MSVVTLGLRGADSARPAAAAGGGGELEAHGEPGKGAGRSGRAELSRGSPRAIRARTRCRGAVGSARKSREDAGPRREGAARVLRARLTRRGAGGPPLSPGAQADRAARPSPCGSPALTPGSRSGPESRRAPAATPSPANARAARPTHRGSAAASAPGAQNALPADPWGAPGLSREPGSPAPPAPGAAPSGGRPPRRERWPRPPCTPPWSSRCADSTRSLQAPPRKACAREGGGGERREEGRAGAGPKEGGGKDGERERRRKGARERRQKKETGGREGGRSQAWCLYWGQSSAPLTGPRTRLAKRHLSSACPRAGFRTQEPGLAWRRRKGLRTSTRVGWGGLGQLQRRPAPPQVHSTLFQAKTPCSPNLAESSLSPEKPKVYQGVRVKITVKELLQQRRAHQAASGGTLSGGNNVHLSDPVPPSSAGLYFEPEPVPSTPNYFQPREFSSCVSCEENPNCLDQIFDSYLQSETHPDPSLNFMQSTPHYFPDSFQAAPFCFNQSLTPGSSSDSSMLSGSLDYSYSPAQLPSYAPENYNSPPSLDTRNCGYSSEDCSYPHLPSHTQCDPFSSATASVCYCASCEAEHLDPFRVSEYFSHPSTDYGNFAPSAAATSDLYQRGANWDICYS